MSTPRVNGRLKAHGPTGASWKPGQSGNPKGRPKGRQNEVLARTAKERAEKYVDQAFRLLSKCVRDKDAPMSSRVSAASVILDRAYGKAPQDVTVRGTIETHIIALLKDLDTGKIDGGEAEVLPPPDDTLE